jgi:hypothetical protein
LFEVKGIDTVKDGIGGTPHHKNQSIFDETELFTGLENLPDLFDMIP